jgi:hypothetical protein
MMTPAADRTTTRRQQQLEQRLRSSTQRCQAAERERLQTIVAAHAAGLSLRQIAAAVGLSRSRIHQLLHARA